MREPRSEAELDALMARLAEGDRSAFEPLFRALQPRALRLARARLGTSSAGDATQSALLKVFARASEFTPGRPVLPWFYAIVSNEVRTLQRKQHRHAHAAGPAREPLPELPDVALDAERQLLQRELSRALEQAIDQLDESSAQAIHAVLERGERPQIDPVRFRKRVSRAYARLRLYLGGEHD